MLCGRSAYTTGSHVPRESSPPDDMVDNPPVVSAVYRKYHFTLHHYGIFDSSNLPTSSLDDVTTDATILAEECNVKKDNNQSDSTILKNNYLGVCLI